MAIRAAAAAGVNITYKILYNDAVAMTGGQPVEGAMTVPQIAQQVLAEGARRVVVVTDEPGKYPKHAGFPAGVAIRHRDDLDAVQRELRDIAGPHRADLRSDLRGGEAPPPQARQISRSARARLHQRRRVRRLRRLLGQIELHCGAAGRDRARPQAPHRPVELQQGFFLPQGLLPELRHRSRRHAAQARRRLRRTTACLPICRSRKRRRCERPYGILVTGVGGTGVVTLGALLGMAAHLEGKGCTVLDISGLAQKNGAVMSHVRLAPQPEDLYAVRVAVGRRRCAARPAIRWSRRARPRCRASRPAPPRPSSTATRSRPRPSSSSRTSISRPPKCSTRSKRRRATATASTPPGLPRR